jgi:hypothetical protein
VTEFLDSSDAMPASLWFVFIMLLCLAAGIGGE